MQTALKELELFIENQDYNFLDKKQIEFANKIQDKVKELQVKETEIIENAFKEGYKECLDIEVHGINDIYSDVEGKDYYKKTFKND